jgi:hypothetical protein
MQMRSSSGSKLPCAGLSGLEPTVIDAHPGLRSLTRFSRALTWEAFSLDQRMRLGLTHAGGSG